MMNEDKFTRLIENFFVDNNDFFTLQDVDISKFLNIPNFKIRIGLLGDNSNEGFTFGFGAVLTNKETKYYDEKIVLKHLQKNFNKLIEKFKLNLDYEKELIDSGDFERWVKQDGFTLENLLECKKDYMNSLDNAVNKINKDINEYLKVAEQTKGDER